MTGNWNATLMAVIFALPSVTAFVGAIIVAIYGREARNLPHALTRPLVTALLIAAFVWGCMVVYLQWPTLFVVLQSVYGYTLMISYVVLYRVIFGLTGTGGQERFSVWHYLVPATIPAVLLIWSFFVPLDAQLHIVVLRDQPTAGYKAYAALSAFRAPAFFAWSILYNLLSLRRIMIYKRVIGNYSADEGRSSVRWLRLFVLYMISVALIPLLALILGETIFFGSLWMLIPILFTSAGIIVLCYNVVSENYVMIAESDACNHKDRRIDRKYFEHYIATRKPYLNPQVRITDVAADLRSNRTYVSNFINGEYGMNFSRYINRQRLRELDSLCLDPKNSDAPGIDLVFQAGFSTYRGYKRVKAEEDAQRTVGF